MIRLSIPDIRKEDRQAINTALQSDTLFSGSEIQSFEKEIANRVGAKFGVAVANGTSAIALALKSCGVGPKDEVLVPAFTFPATAHAVLLIGADPILVDVDDLTWNMNPDLAAKAITSKTKAVLPVDQFGLPADLKKLSNLSRKDGTPITLVEDAACALGAIHHGINCGASVPLACFSFHPRKIITTGEGGMVTSNDPLLIEQIQMLRNLGRNNSGSFVFEAFNLRLNPLAAVLGRSQLRRLDNLLEYRKNLADRYQQRLAKHPALQLQKVPNGLVHSYQTFAVCLSDEYSRELIIKELAKNKIEATIATYGVHREKPYCNDERWTKSNFPVADRLAKQGIALPMHSKLSLEDVDKIVSFLEHCLKLCKREP